MFKANLDEELRDDPDSLHSLFRKVTNINNFARHLILYRIKGYIFWPFLNQIKNRKIKNGERGKPKKKENCVNF